LLKALEEEEDDDEVSNRSSKYSKSDDDEDDDSADSDGDNINERTKRDLFESIKINVRRGSELNNNKLFG
jgi:hypothetical protein